MSDDLIERLRTTESVAAMNEAADRIKRVTLAHAHLENDDAK